MSIERLAVVEVVVDKSVAASSQASKHLLLPVHVACDSHALAHHHPLHLPPHLRYDTPQAAEGEKKKRKEKKRKRKRERSDTKRGIGRQEQSGWAHEEGC